MDEIQQMLNDLPNKKFAKYTDAQLERLQNLHKSNKYKNIYNSDIQSKKGKIPKPKDFGSKISLSNSKRKLSNETKEKIRIKATNRTKPIEKSLQNPKAKIIIDLLELNFGVNEIIRQANCSNGFFYKIKNYYQNNKPSI